MSDPPPKKVGSLRDRIAAFENKGSAPAPAPPPVLRPKPGHVTWQPKAASPPSSPRRDSVADGGEDKSGGVGMSAADAKESIGKLSLRERMAALQGSTAFGGPAAPPPRPTGEKPKWKPPPVVQRAEPIGGEEEEEEKKTDKLETEGLESKLGARSPPAVEESREAETEGEAKEEGEPDPEDEERQRRAALAARMARLGGARVGMGPPIFGKKPDVPPKKIKKEEEKPKEDETHKDEAQVEGVDEHPAAVEVAAAVELPSSTAEDSTPSGSTDYFAASTKKDSDASSTLSPSSAASPPTRSPAMPVPLGPKRAAPPRKRPAKSPSPAPPVVEQEVHETPSPLTQKTEESTIVETAEDVEPSPDPVASREPEVTEGQVEKTDEKVGATEPAAEEPHDEIVAPSETPVPQVDVEAHEQPSPANLSEEPETDEPSAVEPHEEEESVDEPSTQEESHDQEQHPEPEAPIAEPEEDEAARRKRIAERLAKSGGFNPFAGGMPPPVMRRDSADSARSPPPPARRDSAEVARSPPFPARRDSRQEGLRSPPMLPTSPKPELPERKASVGSVQSALELPARRSSMDVGVSEDQRAFEQSTPAHELHTEPIEEGHEDEDEATMPRVEHGSRELRESFVDEPVEEANNFHAALEAEDERESFEQEEQVIEPPPPPPPRASRPLPTVPVVAPLDLDEDGALSFPSPPKTIPPPPPRAVIPPPPPPPPAVEDEEAYEERVESPAPAEEEDVYQQHAQEAGLEHEIEDDPQSDNEDGDRFAHPSEEEKDTSEHDDDGYVTQHHPPRHASIPPPPPPVEEEQEPVEEEEPAPPPPPPPRRFSAKVHPPPPTHAPLAVHEEAELTETAELGDDVEADEPAPPPPPLHTRPVSQIASRDVDAHKPILPQLRDVSSEREEQEVLEDSDVDPIDPGFYSPQRSAGSFSLPATSPVVSPSAPPARVISPPPIASPQPPPHRVVSPPPPPHRAISPPVPEPAASPLSASRHASTLPPLEHEENKGEEEQEDAEQTRRRTIAERMAKLGGIRFGAPPPMPTARRPPPPEPEGESEGGAEQAEEKPADTEETPQEEEEDEFARKQRIAARIAGMGGMRFGMMPGIAPPRAPPRAPREEEESVKSPPPPKRSAPVVPPPPPPPADESEGESDYQHVSDSDQVAQEESELEEVTYTDAENEAPPLPDRGGRQASMGSVSSPPPVPRTRPPAPPAFTYPPPPPHVPPPPAMREGQGGFVMVDQAEETDEPPPPPPRAARPPPRAPPRAPPPEPTAEAEQASSFPNIDFGGETDLSLSGQWSEDSTAYPPPPPGRSPAQAAPEQPQPSAPAPAPAAPTHQPPVEQHLTSDELMGHWGRVGVQVHEISAALFEKSKKSLVGDGSYLGFVNAVLTQVPNAAQPTESLDSFGYLVYSQSAGAVQRRVSDIMPGDIIVVSEAKFKGHKGLQSYNQTVGVGGPLVGIIGDFEAKKSKVKVYQANQHVGQQTVESVSYRLEDLKSGIVKIFRVLEA